jgi:cytochrome o ubiquinol oxidase subunit 1
MIFGRLSLESFPYHEPILVGTFIVVAIGGVAVVGLVTRYGLWGWLWREWFTSVDHKKIGIMYIILGIVMLLRGFADALMMRAQQAIAFAGNEGFLPPHHFDQVFTAHGTIMNFVMPLQIGARDVAFPFLNNLSFWLTVAGAMLIMISLFIGEFSTAGWLNYVPVANLQNSPNTGPDYYLWSLQIAGVGTTLSAINMVATIIKMRAPGMTLMKMPVFTWTALLSNVLVISIFPVLTATLAMAQLDRYAGTNFFTNDLGGNPMMYWNLVWVFGHPEVYVLILPAFGVFSEITSTFCGKRLFGYSSMVYATVVIAILSWLVWLHHFFTMGSGASVNSFFGIATMVISIPTGAKIFNWLFTMYRGRIRFEVPMMWVVAFILTFVIGGLTGVLLAIPPADFVLHNTVFLVAHFHNVIIGGVVFGLLAGISFWWPKAFGFKFDPFWGKLSFWGWVVGFWVAWAPIYIVGLMGVTRRLQHIDDAKLQPWFVFAAVGAMIIAAGIAAFVIGIFVSIRDRERLKVDGDPWGGRTLEWSTTSPPPHYNFAFTPVVHDLDASYDMKSRGVEHPTSGFVPIHMPKNTGAGVIISALAMVLGFAMIWYIWWLAAVSFVAMVGASIAHTFNYRRDYHIQPDEVARIEGAAALPAGA